MEHTEFRVKAKEMVDFMADYLENVRDRRVYPSVKPGFLHDQLPTETPEQGEKWDDIFKDVNDKILPGLVHWQSPHMHAYFPALTSYPSILGEMLSSALNVLCFTWASSPAGTELETISMNWLAKTIGLPECFLNEKNDSPGGGVIQTTASEATLVSLLAARTSALIELSKLNPDLQSSELLGHLIGYCSDQAHSSVEKAGLIGMVRLRYIESDDQQSMRGDKLEEAIRQDKARGLVPFWVCATLGTTGSVAFDNLREVGEVCEKHSIWLHVDAAYAGSCFVCPEYRHWLDGVELADSFAFNPSKWGLVNFDCTAMWVKDSTALHRTFNVNPIYLRHENSGKAIDYMHWQIPLSRRFRSLKLWFVLRNYGVAGLQKHIRENVRLAQKFEALVLADARFEIPQARNLGMVVFRLKGENMLTERLLKRLNARGYIHAVPACFKETYVIRFTVTSPRTTNQDILDDWNEIKTVASDILTETFGAKDGNILRTTKPRISLKDTRDLNATFGTSLLLANSPMSPKIVNGTHAAICDYDQVLTSCAQTFAQLKMELKDSPEMRRRIRGIKMCGKKFSLDSAMDMVQGMVAEQSLPQCKEDEREDASNGSSPGDRSSLSSSPVTSTGTIKQDTTDNNQLQIPPPPSRQFRSKSVDIGLSGLNIEDAKVTIDFKNNEILITPTGSKEFVDEAKAVTFSDGDEQFGIENKHFKAFDDLQEEFQMLGENSQSNDDKIVNDDVNAKVTIRGPGSYIKKLIQQFSEGPFEGEDAKPESERSVTTQSIKERADAICKKCLHYKGKLTK
ncbi:histidine decarboxylase [Pectinophora gossypiella]|uniref:histidine decarboxylase n=1 Tax=Pectinophora gossypiella TaxID=13191 RepID=UPI00214E8A37|nr:histidine decarboxylase [Pectinophora gossypiella]